MAGRQCLFCPKSADSKEHLWSDWILQSLEHRGPIRQMIGDAPNKPFMGPVTVRCVCGKCNNGWMSALEGKVRLLVGSFLHDIPHRLDVEQQEAISLWATKTAMVLDATNTHIRTRFYERHECERLRLQSSIPMRSRIWLGRFCGSGLFAAGTDISLDIGKVPKAAHGCVTTFIVGRLAIQVLTVRFPPQYDGIEIPVGLSPGPWDDLLVDIWPTSNRISWPPALAFTMGKPFPFISLRDRWKTGSKAV
jgi:hypothetical protein